MNKLKKICAVILILSIVATSPMTSMAVDKNVEQETTKSKLVEQLKEDLGEEKAEEILFGESGSESNAESKEIPETEVEEEIVETLVETDEEEASEIKKEIDEYFYESEESEEVSQESEGVNDIGDLLEEETETVSEAETHTSEELAEIEVKNKFISTESETKLYGVEDTTHYLSYGWYNETEAGVLKEKVTKITFQNTGAAPTIYSASFNVDGLTAYIVNGTEVVVYIPTGHTLKLDKNSNFVFSFGKLYDQICESSLTSIVNLNIILTDEATNMSSLFSNNNKINSLDLSNFNTDNVTNMSYMFNRCEKITSLNLSTFNTSNVTTMNSMFAYCCKITNLYLSVFNTDNTTSMSQMFMECNSLTSLNISSFTTSLVTSFDNMFMNCEKLSSIDLSGFNTSKATSLHAMFYGCKSLTSIDISNFDTSNINNLGYLFTNCYSLTNLTLFSTETENVTNMRYMFYKCKNLTSLDLSFFNTVNTTDMYQMFYECYGLETLNISNFNMDNATYDDMLYGLSSLNTIVISSSVAGVINELKHEFDWKKQSGSTIYKYDNVNSKTTIPNEAGAYVRAIDENRVTIIFDSDGGSYVKSQTVNINSKIVKPYNPTKNDNIFVYWYKDNINTEYDFNSDVTESFTLYAKWEPIAIITSYWYIKNGNELHFSSTVPSDPAYTDGQTFSNFNAAIDIPWSQFSSQIEKVVIDNIIYPTSTAFLFSGLRNVTEIVDISNLKTDNVVFMSNMFSGCESLTDVNLSTFNTNKVTRMINMFSNCKNLNTLDLSSFNTTNVDWLASMFHSCKNLTSIDMSNFNTENVIDMTGLFYGCEKLSNIDLSSFNIEKTTSLASVFHGCKSLTSLDLTNFNTQRVNNTMQLFADCSALRTIYVSNDFVTTYVSNSRSMFENCTVLVGGKGTVFNASHIDKEYARIDGGPTSSTPGYFSLKSGTKTLESISVKTAPTKLKYAIGEIFDPTGLKINLIYDNGSVEELTYADHKSDFSFNPSGSLNTAGAAIPITITYTKNGNSFDCIQNVEVVELSGISINTPATKSRYIKGTNFDPTGLKINLLYSDGSSDVVTYNTSTSAGFTFNGASSLTLDSVANPFTVNIGYAGKTTTQNIIVAELDSIDILTHATKLNYMTGENFDATGLVIKLVYSDGETETITYNKSTSTDFSFSPDAPLTRTGNVITITYAGKTTTETLNVKQLDSITIHSNPTKLNYATGQSLNPAGLVLTLSYIDSNDETTTQNVTYNNSIKSKFKFSPNGALTTSGNIIITYDGKTGTNMQPTFAVTVRTVASISIITKPSKTSYTAGNKLAPSGLSIKVNYEDRTNEVITYSSNNANDFTFNPSLTTSLTTNHKNVTVSYGGKSTAFAITVEASSGYVPSGGGSSSGGSGGSGGGGIAPNTNTQTNNPPTTTKISTNKSISNVLRAETSTWATDPVTGKWKLNSVDANGQAAAAVNGFYMMTATVTQLVNNIPIQAQVNDTYYFDAVGNMVTGWVQTADSKWYFF